MRPPLQLLFLGSLALALLATSAPVLAQDQGGVIGEPGAVGEPPPPPPAASPDYQAAPPPPTAGYQAAPPQAAPSPTAPPAPTAPMEREDRPRFRGGVAFTGGGEFFSKIDYSAIMFGVDGRFGVQINDLVGLYLESHLSFGGERGLGYSGTTATFANMAMVDFTLADTFFIGGGVGYMIFNNPRGPGFAFRVGAYPAKRVGPGRSRKGLMLSLETRVGFLGNGNGSGTQIMAAIGYETF